MKATSQSLLGFLLISFVLISCTHKRSPVTISKEVNPNTSEGQLVVFDLKKLPDKSTVKLSEIGAMEIKYIPLKTSPQNVIPQINSILFSKSYFLTRGFTSINMFRIDGSFITEVGTKGRGPYEFTGISDVDINPENESIYIADGEKFLVFNKDGEIVRTFKSPLRGQMQFTEDGILCFFIDDKGNIENSYILIDTIGRIIKQFPNRYPWKRIAPGVGYAHENLFYRFNNQLFKKEIYCDTIFVYNKNVFEPHIIIDVGDQRLTPDVRTNIRTISDAEFVLRNHLSPWNLFEFGDFIYYEIGTTVNGVRDLFSFIGSKTNNFKALVVPFEGLINNLDGGPNIWPRTIKDNNTLVSWVEALKFKEYIATNTFKNSNPIYPDKKKELEKLADSIQENDNPIIILIKVK